MKRIEREKHSWMEKKLKDAGAETLTVHGHMYQKSSWPDLQVYHPVWTGHIEFKVDGREIELGQTLQMERLWQRGTPAWVLRYDTDVDQWVVETPRGKWEVEILALESEDNPGLALMEVLAGLKPPEGLKVPRVVWRQGA